MNPASNNPSQRRDNGRDSDASRTRTPNSDMEPEDTGTEQSSPDRGNATDDALKQARKTPTDSGSDTQ